MNESSPSKSTDSNDLLLNFLTNSFIIIVFSGPKWMLMIVKEESVLF